MQRSTEHRSQCRDQPQQASPSLQNKTHPSTMSLESNNVITVPRLRHCAYTTHSQTPAGGKHGTDTRSAQQGAESDHPSAKSHEEPLYRKTVLSQPYLCQQSLGFSIQTHTPCSTHIPSAQDTIPCTAHGVLILPKPNCIKAPFVVYKL